MKFRKSLFWDTNTDELNIEKHSKFIIERILEFGNSEEVKWCIKTYGKDAIKQLLPQLHLSDKSASFWQNYL